MSHSTYVEKKTVMSALFAYCQQEGISDIAKLTKPMLYQFLSEVADERGSKRQMSIARICCRRGTGVWRVWRVFRKCCRLWSASNHFRQRLVSVTSRRRRM